MEYIGKKLSTKINKNTKKLISSNLHISVNNIVILFIINNIVTTDGFIGIHTIKNRI